MRLVYTATQKPVTIGDTVKVHGHACTVSYFPKPHKPDSSGKVTVDFVEGGSAEYFVGIIGAEWIEREDRPVAEDADYLTQRAERRMGC